jgi:hypothetical protein
VEAVNEVATSAPERTKSRRERGLFIGAYSFFSPEDKRADTAQYITAASVFRNGVLGNAEAAGRSSSFAG